MLIGHVGRLEVGLVGGWAADTDAPDAVVDVIIYVDGKRAARVACNRPRADLRDLGSYGEGRHGFHYEFPVALPVEILDRVCVRFARSGAILPDGERKLSGSVGLQPILVTAPGRSGTTLMMNQLSSSPQICVAETPPFEVRQLSYWSTVVSTLTGEADFERSMHPDHLEGDGFKVGANPFSYSGFMAAFRAPELQTEYFGTYGPDEMHDFARKMITEYYLRLRDDRDKGEAVYFAEKANSLRRPMRTFTRAIFGGTKEIVLIRDPRDLLCSQLSVFRSQADQAFRDITGATIELLRIKREETVGVTFVKYEEFVVLDRGAVLARLAAFLGIAPFQTSDRGREKSVFEVHATSESPEASIGRWKAELSTEQRGACASMWAPFISEFQYDM